MKFVTIKDIAKKLGVSHQTVSRALNNDSRVKKETAEKIKALAIKMSYIPNTAARSLVRAKSKNIAVVTFSYSLLYPTMIMRGIEQVINKSDIEIDYYNTQRFFSFSVSVGIRESYIFDKILDERRAGAVILMSVNMPEKTILNYKKAGIHIIYIEVTGIWGHRVHYNNKMAAALAVNHLVERKRKRIGMMIGNTEVVLSFNERLQGFRETMLRHGKTANEKNIFEFKNFIPDLGKKALDFFLENKIDAIYVAASDPHMLEILVEIRKRGLKVPDDIAIISQDDMGLPLAANVTAIKQPGEEMGKKAAEIAIWAIKENNIKNMRDELFYPELIIREST